MENEETTNSDRKMLIQFFLTCQIYDVKLNIGGFRPVSHLSPIEISTFDEGTTAKQKKNGLKTSVMNKKELKKEQKLTVFSLKPS